MQEKSSSADDRLHARFRNKSRKCVKNALKKHDVFVVFFSGAADDKEKRGDCLQEETPSAGDEHSARLQAVHFISLKNEMKNP